MAIDEGVMTEEFPVVNSLPLRLAVCPQAIIDHFENDEQVTSLPREMLLEIGEHVLTSDVFYKAFHEALCVAVEEIAGFQPAEERDDDATSTVPADSNAP